MLLRTSSLAAGHPSVRSSKQNRVGLRRVATIDFLGDGVASPGVGDGQRGARPRCHRGSTDGAEDRAFLSLIVGLARPHSSPDPLPHHELR